MNGSARHIDVPVEGVRAVEDLAAHVEGRLVRDGRQRRVLVEAQIHDSPRCEADQVPAVKVRGVEHGVEGQEHEGLDLRHVSRGQGPVGVGQGFGDKVDALCVHVVFYGLALGRRANGQDHVEEPVARFLDDAVVLAVDVVENGQERRLGEAGIEGIDVGHEVLHDGEGGGPGGRPEGGGAGMLSFVVAARTSLANVTLLAEGSKSREVASTDLWAWSAGREKTARDQVSQEAKVGDERVDVVVLASPGGLAMDGRADRGEGVPPVDLVHDRGVWLMESDGCLAGLGILQAPLELFYAKLEGGDVAGDGGGSANDCYRAGIEDSPPLLASGKLVIGGRAIMLTTGLFASCAGRQFAITLSGKQSAIGPRGVARRRSLTLTLAARPDCGRQQAWQWQGKAADSHREHADTGRETLSRGLREKLVRGMAANRPLARHKGAGRKGSLGGIRSGADGLRRRLEREGGLRTASFGSGLTGSWPSAGPSCRVGRCGGGGLGC